MKSHGGFESSRPEPHRRVNVDYLRRAICCRAAGRLGSKPGKHQKEKEKNGTRPPRRQRRPDPREDSEPIREKPNYSWSPGNSFTDWNQKLFSFTFRHDALIGDTKRGLTGTPPPGDVTWNQRLCSSHWGNGGVLSVSWWNNRFVCRMNESCVFYCFGYFYRQSPAPPSACPTQLDTKPKPKT